MSLSETLKGKKQVMRGRVGREISTFEKGKASGRHSLITDQNKKENEELLSTHKKRDLSVYFNLCFAMTPRESLTLNHSE